MNVVVLRGTLSRPPAVRTLPSGDRLGAFEVTVRHPERPAESVPVVWFEVPEQALAFGAGDEVLVLGRVRRRFFQAKGARGSRTEVVASVVLGAQERVRAQGLLDVAVAALTDEEPATERPALRVVPGGRGSTKMGGNIGRKEMGIPRQ